MINWFSMKAKREPKRSYLVRAVIVGPVYDVAFYEGKRPDGTDWWIIGDASIPQTALTHWAEITEPEY